jgi:hypothetical protein
VRLPLVYVPRSKSGLFPLLRLVSRGIKLRLGNGQTNVAYVGDIVEITCTRSVLAATEALGALHRGRRVVLFTVCTRRSEEHRCRDTKRVVSSSSGAFWAIVDLVGGG